VLAGAVELLSFAALNIRRHFFPAPFLKNIRVAFGPCRGTGDAHCRIDSALDMMSASPVYDGEPWAEGYWREMRAHYSRKSPYDPFLKWANLPVSGHYLNLEK